MKGSWDSKPEISKEAFEELSPRLSQFNSILATYRIVFIFLKIDPSEQRNRKQKCLFMSHYAYAMVTKKKK